jgi:ABC-2 type transport system ATP-binding protein
MTDFPIETKQLSWRAPQGLWQRLRRQEAPLVLDAISLQIPHGSTVGLVGRNGAGKSTLMRCVLGLEAPSGGQCHLAGEDPMQASPELLQRLGVALQSPELLDWLTGLEHLNALSRAYAGFNDLRAHQLAKQLALPMDRKAGTLSLGDQQKLALLLALVHDPDILLLDEPVASLDPMSRRAFMRALFDLEAGANHRTTLISSHLLGDLERIVSHVIFLRAGRVQLFDAWDSIMEHVRRVPWAPAMADSTGLLHQLGDHALVDMRQWHGPLDGAEALGMDDLFEAFNS